MAHQRHKLPWGLFAGNLAFNSGGPRVHGITNLYLKPRTSQQINEISHFFSIFIKTLEEHVQCERKKYTTIFESPDLNEPILPDNVAQKITPTVHRYRQAMIKDGIIGDRACVDPLFRNKLCRHITRESQPCGCAIDYTSRLTPSFLQGFAPKSNYRTMHDNEPAVLNVELVRTLILYGELEPLLRLFARPDAKQVYLDAWRKGPCHQIAAYLGWKEVCKMALQAHICLNVLYCFPDLWDPTTRAERTGGAHERRDYRDTKAYQKMFYNCTESHSRSLATGTPSYVAYYPHKQFFGVPDGHWTPWFREDVTPFGSRTFDAFLALDERYKKSSYMPTLSDVGTVRSILRVCGLPDELVVGIMETAAYTPQKRLEAVPQDPLHPDNETELLAYLKYCWMVMVRCHLLVEELGGRLEWREMLLDCIYELWGREGMPKYDMLEHRVQRNL